MSLLSGVAQKIQTVLGSVADNLGKSTGFIKRQRKFTGSKFIKTLVFGWIQKPEASLDELTQSGVLNDVEITNQGLDKRFTPEAAQFSKSVLEAAVSEIVRAPIPVPIELLNRFSRVYLFDTTIINLPDELKEIWEGTGGRGPTTRAALKGEVGFELKTGQLIGPFLLPGKTNDNKGRLLQTELPKNSLILFDLGYYSIEKIWSEKEKKRYTLSRFRHDTVVFNESGELFDLSAYTLEMKKKNIPQVELKVLIGEKEQLPVRLFIQRVPEAVSAKRRGQAKKRAQKKGKTPSKKSLSLCDVTLLITTAPVEILHFEEALVLYATRWQIELLFKLWKSHAKLHTSKSSKPWRILCEIYIKLLACLVQHWLILMGCWNNPNRSLVKAAQVVRTHTNLIAINFNCIANLIQALQIIMRGLNHGCRQNNRRKHPNTWRTLIECKPKWT